MGLIGSKCKVKVDNTDIGEYVKYEKLHNQTDNDHARGEKKIKCKDAKENSGRNERIPTNKGSSSWEAVIPEVDHMDDCKHYKSLSLTTQVSPKSTATTDGDDVGSVSTLTSMLENPLLKCVKPDNPLYKRADAEFRPVGPVHPWKLGKDKDKIRLELEEKGLLKSKMYQNYSQKIDPKEEGIIGDLKGVGIISHDVVKDTMSMGLANESTRRLPTRLTHLPTEVSATKLILPDDNPVYKLDKITENPPSSKSEIGTECTTLQQTTNEHSSIVRQENDAAVCSRTEVVSLEKKETDLLDLKIKIIDTEIL